MTQQNIAPKIDDFTQIDATSKGIVRSGWNPNFGYDRKKEIELARQAALEEQRKIQEEQQPINLRLTALEGEVMRLKAAVKELTDAQKQ